MPHQVDELKLWREQVGRHVLRVDFAPLDGQPFDAFVSPVLMADGAKIALCGHSPGRVFRDKELLRDGEDSVSLLIARTNAMEISHRGRFARLAPGEAVLMQNFEPGQGASAKNFGFLSITIPSQRLSLKPNGHEPFASPIPRSNHALHLLKAYIQSLKRLPALDEDLTTATTRHIHELVALTLSAEARAPGMEEGRSVPEARLRIARDFLARHFRDPGLSLARAAADQNISLRYLEKLFERAGLRFVEEVNGLRLEYAHRLLSDPASAGKRIADIAFESGFSDLSHFNRLFRQRFDATPSTLRGRKVAGS
jgi:AraC-like DNA-binding protein